MKYENYFANVPKYENLDIEEVIFEDGFPVFFTAKSNNFQRFICICCDIVKEQRWIIAPISNDNLIKLLTNQLTMHDSFLTENICIIARWSKENPVLQYEEISSSDIVPEDLPVEGEYIESEAGEYSSYISLIESSAINFSFASINTTFIEMYKKKNKYALDGLISKLFGLLTSSEQSNLISQETTKYNKGDLRWALN